MLAELSPYNDRNRGHREMYKCLMGCYFVYETSNILDVNFVTCFPRYKSLENKKPAPRGVSRALNSVVLHAVMKERAEPSLWPLPKHGHAVGKRGSHARLALSSVS